MNSNFNNKSPSFTLGSFYLFRILKINRIQSKFSIAAKLLLPSLFLVCFSTAHAGLTDGLVAYYCFDDASNISKDCSANGNNGSPSGQVNSVTGWKGNAASFGGYKSPASIHIPNSTSLQFSQDFSVAFAVKMTGFDGMDGWGSYASFGAHAAVAKSHDRRGMALLAYGDSKTGNVGTGVASFGWNNPIGGNAPNSDVDKWVHFTYIFSNKQHKTKLFANGTLVATKDGFSQDLSAMNSQDLYLGKYSDYWYPLNGALDDVRIYNRTLTDAEVTALSQQDTPTPPKITSITPIEAVIGKPTIFTVKGKNLSADMGFTVGDCQYSNVALAGGTPQLQRFVCTQFGAAGTKRGLIKTKPGGTTVYKFNSKAVLVPSTTPMATITGQVKIGSQIGGNIVLSGGDTVNACLTNSTGQFRCQVPENWTGTLMPQAKGVKFSPALISVRNATGTKSLNDTVTKVAFTGTPLDSFPVNGIISSDWKKLTPDQPIWKLEIANGEIDDVNSYEGRFSLRSAKIAANQNASIQTTINVTQASDVVFARRVSSNDGHGVLSFYIDNQAVDSWSGELGWEMQQYPITAGIHTLRWDYKKDNAVAMGADAAWIDAVSYPSSVIAAQAGQTTKTTCEGITAGTLSLMTIKKPTCEQLHAYLAWLKVVNVMRMKDTEVFTNAIKGIETKNKLVQDFIDVGAKIYALGSIINTKGLVDQSLAAGVEFTSSVAGTQGCDAITDPVNKVICDNAKTGGLTLIEYGFKRAAAGALGTVSVYPYAIEKAVSTGFNLWYAVDLNSNTEQLNSINIANDLLDEYYKGGMNFTAMCSKYGVICNDLSAALVDAVANKKGYHNDWYGAEYLNDMVVNSINDAIAKNNAILRFALTV